jgi:hypothetical protein
MHASPRLPRGMLTKPSQAMMSARLGSVYTKARRFLMSRCFDKQACDTAVQVVRLLAQRYRWYAYRLYAQHINDTAASKSMCDIVERHQPLSA